MTSKRKDNKGRLLRKGESQRKDNMYMYRWVDCVGKRKSIYATTLEGLRKKEEEIVRETVFGISGTLITLNEQIEIYFKTKSNLAESTLNNYMYYYNHSIKDSVLGRMRVKDIRKSHILIFYKSYYDSGYSAGTIKILQKIIRPSLQLACDDGIIMKNPADGCMKNYHDDMEKKYALTHDEEIEFLYRIKEDAKIKRYYPMYAIMLNTGLRISETIGLTWDDVDFDKKEIKVDHQVQYRLIDGKTQYYASKTKTKAGIRVIPMTDTVYSLFIKQRMIWFKVKKDVQFQIDGYKNFVFLSHVTGRCMNHNSIRRMLRRVVSMNSKREVKLPAISPHILRHTACSRMAEAGCDIKVLQYILGQSDIRTTMKVYNHINPERVRREVDRIQKNQIKIG